MVIFNTQGIVLRTSRYSENDVILTIFTRNLGKVSAIAKGAKRNKSALLPSAQLFAYSNFTLKKQRGMYRVSQSEIILGKVSAIAKGAKRNKSALLPSAQLFAYSNFTLKKQRGMYRVSQSEIIKSFYDISYDIDAFSYASYISRLVENSLLENQTNRKLFNLIVKTMYLLSQKDVDKYDIDAFSYASYISRLVENSLLENQTNRKLFNLIVKTMYLLSQKDVDKEFITAAFELKFSDCMGFRPITDRCSVCGDESDQRAIFNIEEGGMLCKKCAENFSGNIRPDCMGFRPITDRCSVCGDESDQRAIFNIEEGGMLCKKCAENFSGNIRLDVTTRKLMNYILSNEIETVSRAKVNKVLTKELSKLMKQYLTAYVSNLNMKSRKLMNYILSNEIETVSRAKVNKVLTKELSKLMKQYLTAYVSNLNMKSLNILDDLHKF